MDILSLGVGAVLPYVIAGITIGVRKKSAMAGLETAWGMLQITFGMFSEHLKPATGESDGT